jgi:hypothetical protein
MKRVNLDPKTLLVLALAFLRADSGLSQVAAAPTNHNAGADLAEFHPAINGLGSKDVVSALRLPDDEFIFFCKTSGQAIIKSSTNGLCFLKGRFSFAAKSPLPDHVADIYVSQPFSANELSLDHAVAFEKQMQADFSQTASPNTLHIDLDPILQTENQTVPSEVGTPLRSVGLEVQDGRLVLAFESYTRIKGKVVLDDRLNPISMTQTGIPDPK